ADRNRSHWSTSKTPSYTKSVSWQHHPLVEWRIWFEAYFLLCYVPCLIYYFFYCRFLWHNDFMMACDMYFRWGHFNK
ncbi:hypothetical protein APT10_10605, partial [Escherichia coli]